MRNELIDADTTDHQRLRADEAIDLLREVRKTADCWPRVAYSYDLAVRIDALLSKERRSAARDLRTTQV